MTTAGLTPSKTLFIQEDSWGALSSYLIHSFISFHTYFLNTSHDLCTQLGTEDIVNKTRRGPTFIHGDDSLPGVPSWCHFFCCSHVFQAVPYPHSPIAYELVLEACHSLQWAQLFSEHWDFLAFQARRPFTSFTLLDFQIGQRSAHSGLEPSLQELHWNKLIVAQSLGWILEKYPINKYQVIWGLSWWFTSILSHLCGVKGKLGKCVGHNWHEPETFSGKGEGFQSRVSSDSWNRKDYAKIKKAKVNTKPVNKEWAQRGEILLWKQVFLQRRKTRTCWKTCQPGVINGGWSLHRASLVCFSAETRCF